MSITFEHVDVSSVEFARHEKTASEEYRPLYEAFESLEVSENWEEAATMGMGASLAIRVTPTEKDVKTAEVRLEKEENLHKNTPYAVACLVFRNRLASALNAKYKGQKYSPSIRWNKDWTEEGKTVLFLRRKQRSFRQTT